MTNRLLALVLLSLVATAVFMGVRASHRPAEAGPPTAEEAKTRREERQRPVAELAPRPAAQQVPIAGKEGIGAEGYPTQYVDRVAVRGMLRLRRFAELTQLFEQLQAKFEENPRYEYWPVSAMQAFGSAEAELAPLLDAWVQASPTSFAPYLARGEYLNAVAWKRRGGGWAKDTHDADFAEMRATHERALPDLDKALSLRPKCVAALQAKVYVYQANSMQEEMAKAATLALTVCPACMSIRVAWIGALTPRWGGTYESMLAVARSAKPARNPRLRFLAGYVDKDRADLLLKEKRHDEAMVAINRACALGDHAPFLEKRAEIYRDQKKLAEARRDLDRAHELAPGDAGILVTRAYVLNGLKDYEASARDLLDALRLEPTVSQARELRKPAVAALMFTAGQHHTAHREADAMRVVELAIELDPENREAQAAKGYYVTKPDAPATPAAPGAKAAPTADPIEQARAAAKAAPDDFKAHQRLDYLLAQQRRFPEVIELWNEFLARHPDHGAAFMERAGAHWNAGHRAEAGADAQKACDLGISEGCVRAKQALGR